MYIVRIICRKEGFEMAKWCNLINCWCDDAEEITEGQICDCDCNNCDEMEEIKPDN